MKSIFTILLFLVLICQQTFGQKVAIIGINYLNPQGWAFVALEDLPSGTDIYFTDEDYDDLNNKFDCVPCNTGLESLFHWEAVGQLNKGCVIYMEETASNVLTITAQSSGCNAGTVTVIDPAISLSNTDPLYAFSSSGDPTQSNPANELAIMADLTEIHSVVSLGASLGNRDPQNDYPNAIALFLNTGNTSAYAEYSANRTSTVGPAELGNLANYTVITGTNVDPLDVTAFADISLPIELISFKGFLRGEKVELIWKTATEFNNDYMVIERSSDGRIFEKIGQVQAQATGTTFQAQAYSLMDKNPMLGLNYYRLRQVDFDGNEEVFSTIVVPFKSGENDIHFFPTQVEQSISIQLKEEINIDTQVEIFYLSGQKVMESTILAGDIAIEMEVSHLVKGSYFARLTIGNEVITKRFIKM